MDDFEIYEEDGDKILTSYNGSGKKVVVPEGIVAIDNFDDDFVFHQNGQIEEVVLPESLEYIGRDAFSGCAGLKRINFPRGLSMIGDSAFCGCESLEEIDLPDTLEVIGMSAFEKCGKLKVEKIPSSLIEVPVNAFENTTEVLLKNKDYVRLGDFVYNSETKAVLYAPDADSDDESLDDSFLVGTVLPLDAKVIGANSLSFGQFDDVKIPASVEYIGTGAFMFCQNLKKVVIPKNVHTIDSGAFINCQSLEEVVFEGTEPVTLGSMAFSGCPNLKSVAIPKGSDYENAFDDGVSVSEK